MKVWRGSPQALDPDLLTTALQLPPAEFRQSTPLATPNIQLGIPSIRLADGVVAVWIGMARRMGGWRDERGEGGGVCMMSCLVDEYEEYQVIQSLLKCGIGGSVCDDALIDSGIFDSALDHGWGFE